MQPTAFRLMDPKFPVKVVGDIENDMARLDNFDGEEYTWRDFDEFPAGIPQLGDEVVPGYNENYDVFVVSVAQYQQMKEAGLVLVDE